MLQPTYVTSSTIDAIGFQLGKLYVRFKSGATYMYDAVPFAYFVSLKEVESAGRFLNKFIKGKHHYTKLEHDPFSGEAAA